MPHYRINLFGPQAQLAGADHLVISTDAPLTAADLLQRIGDRHPALADSIPVSRIASNHSYVTPDTMLDADAELALIGLVSGG